MRCISFMGSFKYRRPASQSGKHLKKRVGDTRKEAQLQIKVFLCFWVANNYLDCSISRALVAWMGRASVG